MSLESLLARLEALRTRFAPGDSRRVRRLLSQLARQEFHDAETLIRLHEALLFLRAFPHDGAVVRRCEALLKNFVQRVQRLRAAGADLSAMEPLEVSGIAGTGIEDALSYDVTRWLARRFPDRVRIVWDGYEEERLMGNTWPRFIPLLQEDSYVEANIPWRKWLEAAKGPASNELLWFLDRFERLPFSPAEKSEIYDGLQMVVRWELDNLRASRTRNWHTPPRFFFHDGSLIARKEVSLAQEFAAPALPIAKLSSRRGEQVLDLVREVMAVRYRELYGTTLGDPRQVFRAAVGRGVEIFLWGLPAERRLPLRAYLAGLTLKNGVPINYIEAIALFEWMEIGFNTFYTFRDGETAWIYAKALRLLRQLMGFRCVSVYPYQIGLGNEEAIESGAFWFYRKLGFRPGRADLARLTAGEERRIAARSGYRTPPRTLRRLAGAHIFYELPGAEVGAWDRFSTRNLGLQVSQRMAQRFGGDARRIRDASAEEVASSLGVRRAALSALEARAFEDLALVLALLPQLRRWDAEEKRLLVRIIRSKSGADELEYLRLLQRHARLRKAILRLGAGKTQ